MQTCEQHGGDVQHLIGTRFVPSVVPYISEMTGILKVLPIRPTRESRFNEIEYVVEDGIITGIHVYRNPISGVIQADGEDQA